MNELDQYLEVIGAAGENAIVAVGRPNSEEGSRYNLLVATDGFFKVDDDLEAMANGLASLGTVLVMIVQPGDIAPDVLCPECAQGKPVNCAGVALLLPADVIVTCATERALEEEAMRA